MQIQTFNQKLVDENVDINIIEYVILLNENFYNMDISFIDDFIILVDKDECCIHHILHTLLYNQISLNVLVIELFVSWS